MNRKCRELPQIHTSLHSSFVKGTHYSFTCPPHAHILPQIHKPMSSTQLIAAAGLMGNALVWGFAMSLRFRGKMETKEGAAKVCPLNLFTCPLFSSKHTLRSITLRCHR